MSDPTPTAKPRGRFALRLLRRALLGLIVLLLIASAAAYLAVRASLARLDGEVLATGLQAAVRVERDQAGVPTLRGANRDDVAFATGFVHAQERFFQMDLMRRQAAGELSELLGRGTLELDRDSRRDRFRSRATAAVGGEPQARRRLLAAYTAGVNAGLQDLGARPPEYLLLRASPTPWRDEDTILVLYSMFSALQDGTGSTDLRRGVLHDTLPPALAAFLDPPGTSWDAPVDGGVAPEPPLPGSDIVDLRHPQMGANTRAVPAAQGDEVMVPGSNSWALAGSRSADGRALLANDMHLELAVPNTWYRAVLEWTEGGQTRRLAGVTLPGTPMLVVGSNGAVAWGFTASLADTSDIVLLDRPSGGDRESYLTPTGVQRISHVTEEILVKGGAAEQLDVAMTIWGPVIGEDHGRTRVLRWVAHDSGDLGLLGLETATTVTEALDIGAASGAPTLNLVAADGGGHIGWTIAGPLPRRLGWDGRTPVSFADGSRRWDGLLPAQEHPRVVDPGAGALWTANNRVVSGAAQVLVGDGGLDLGARARQIRDDLAALSHATERDLVAVQLDDRALFLAPWRELLLATLSPQALADHLDRAEGRRLVETSWDGHASVSSVGYRIVRGFRAKVAETVLGDLSAPCRAADKDFAVTRLGQVEGPLWRLVNERPAHLLGPTHASWNALLLEACDTTLADLAKVGPRLAERTWGERNTARIRHPLSFAVPGLGRLLDMPAEPLPGDLKMPRVQAPNFGASERLVVSPGHETDGVFNMPGGQSGHPLSPFYRGGHQEWVHGESTSLLPGPATTTLTLHP